MRARIWAVVAMACVSLDACVGFGLRPTDASRTAAQFFGEQCLKSRFSFEEQNARAKAKGYVLVKEEGRAPDPKSATFRMNTWRVDVSPNQSYSLMFAETAVGTGMHRDGCYLGTPDISGDEMEPALEQLARIDKTSKKLSGFLDGVLNVTWSASVGDASRPELSQVMLTKSKRETPESMSFLTIESRGNR